jgi:hypothetical protein
MEELGHWFAYQVIPIEVEDGLTHPRALDLYDDARQRLARRGFVHSLVTDYRPMNRQADQLSLAEQVTA